MTALNNEQELQHIVRLGATGETKKLHLGNSLEKNMSILVIQTTNHCALNDHPICQNTHWRVGYGFEDQKRCPQHEFSWEPGEWIGIILNGDFVDPRKIRPSTCEYCPVANQMQSPNDFVRGNIECHSDGREQIEPAGICRGLAIARGWITAEGHLSIEELTSTTEELTLEAGKHFWFVHDEKDKTNRKITVHHQA